MATRNGQSVFDLVTDSYRRKIQEMGAHSEGHSIPKELREEFDLEAGDEVVIKRAPPESEAIYEVHADTTG